MAAAALVISIIAMLLWHNRSINRLNRALRFQARLLDVVDIAVIAVDEMERITYWNHFAEELFGWTREEVTGRLLGELVFPEITVVQGVQALDLENGASSRVREIRPRNREGREFQARMVDTPIVESGGKTTGMVSLARDISDEIKLQQQLRQALKMEAIGRLAGGIAHDFNNLLTVMKGETELATLLVGEQSETGEQLRHVNDAIDRAAALTHQLLAFSRMQVLHPKNLDIRQLLNEIHPMLGRLIREDISFHLDCTDDLWLVQIGRGQLEQVLINLLVNASDAMPDGGALTIAACNVPQRHADPGQEGRDWVEITVSDTGVGIEPGAMDHVFEPFYTTKEVGKGTGLGLATVHGIITQSGGEISVESLPASGATFRILLPRADTREDIGETMARSTDTVLPLEPRDIMVVEDEPGVRSVLVQMLEGAGHRVIVEDSPSKALRKLDSIGAVDLLVTDVVMPEMSSPATAPEARVRIPDLPVLFVTGYSREELSRDAGEKHVLFKPFGREDLLREVAALLNS